MGVPVFFFFYMFVYLFKFSLVSLKKNNQFRFISNFQPTSWPLLFVQTSHT